MTELYIAGQRVVLPENFSITIVDENPFFTKSGKYTYDITLSLLNSANAKIYKHLNRQNNKADIEKNRTAYMVVNNEVVINGTEAILGFTDKDVKIQLVSGNSELNFLIGGDKKLRDMDLGKADFPIDTVFFEDRIKYSYPQVDYHFLPFAVSETDLNINTSSLSTGNNYGWIKNPNRDEFRTILYSTYSKITPQPYFCFIINSVIKALGYTLTRNAIAEHPIFKNAYLVHGIQTRVFAEMLPDWTIIDFFSKVEQQFDCTFIVDPYTKTVDLVFNSEVDSDSYGSDTLEVFDDKVIDIDEDNQLDVRGANIGYSLDNLDYFKFKNIDRRYVDMAIKEPYSNFRELKDKISNASDEHRFEKIFTNDILGYFIAYNEENGISFREIDAFAPIYNNPNSYNLDYEFDIIPAAITYARLEPASDLRRVIYYVQLAVTPDFDSLDLENKETPSSVLEESHFNLQNLIEGTDSIEKIVPSKIRLAIYPGLTSVDPAFIPEGVTPSVNIFYPNVYVESLCEYFHESNTPRYFMEVGQNPFRLKNMFKDIYQRTTKTDTTKVYKLPIYNKKKINVFSKFTINNKRFRCEKIERELTEKGFKNRAVGYFYPYTDKVV